MRLFQRLALAATTAVTLGSPVVSAQNSPPKDWASSVNLPRGEIPRKLFDGSTLEGWRGKIGTHFNVVRNEIHAQSHGGRPNGAPRASTYLTSSTQHRHFRLLLEAKVDGESTVHTGIALLGKSTQYKEESDSYQGHLVMIHDARSSETTANEWGLFELMRRNWLTGSVSGNWCPTKRARASVEIAKVASAASEDGWHQIEVLVYENTIRVGLNGFQIVDYVDPDPDLLEKGSIGLQLHWLSENDERSQRVRFRGLIVVDDPMSKELVTTTKTTTEMTKREETSVGEKNWVKSWRRKHLSQT